MMVAVGYKTVDDTTWVEVDNPDPVGEGNREFIVYDEYVSGADHTHWMDYYDIR
jgi:hypothetical protein